jgi:hypothetical protein
VIDARPHLERGRRGRRPTHRHADRGGPRQLLLAGIVALLFVESSGQERRTRNELDHHQMRHDHILAAEATS